MGLFKKNKKIKGDEYNKSANDEKLTTICNLYQGSPNKYGTYVLSAFTLYYNDTNNLYQIEKGGRRFDILDIEWKGKNIINNTISISNTTGNEKNKRTGRVLGATLGTVIAPGIGTVIGAAHGTGNSKSKNSETTVTKSYEQVKEEVSDIILCVKYESGETEKLKYQCYEKQANILLSLLGKEGYINSNDDNNSPYGEIKQLKELLDMGAITQEEFDAKKRELLGL